MPLRKPEDIDRDRGQSDTGGERSLPTVEIDNGEMPITDAVESLDKSVDQIFDEYVHSGELGPLEGRVNEIEDAVRELQDGVEQVAEQVAPERVEDRPFLDEDKKL